MGTLGTGIFSDDLAADLRSDFRDLIGEGLSLKAAVDRILKDYRSSLKDDDERPIFWLGLAATQWKLGRLELRTKREALRIIESGEDLRRWEDEPALQKKRKAVLTELRKQLLSRQPTATPLQNAFA